VALVCKERRLSSEGERVLTPTNLITISNIPVTHKHMHAAILNTAVTMTFTTHHSKYQYITLQCVCRVKVPKTNNHNPAKKCTKEDQSHFC